MRSPSPCSVRRRLAGAAVGVALLSFAGCARVWTPRSIEVPLQRLQDELAQRTATLRWSGPGFAFRLAEPQLVLLAASNRVAVSIPAVIDGPLFPRPVKGLVALSFGLAFDPSAQAVRAVDVGVDALRIDGLDPAVARFVERVARPLAAGALEGATLHVLRASDVERMNAAGLVPGAIRVRDSGIHIELLAAGR